MTTTTQQESVDQYKWRWRQYAINKATYHGTPGMDELFEALDEMGCGQRDLPLGPGVVIETQAELARVPEGTILYCGDPDSDRHISRFGVFVKVRGMMNPVLGCNTLRFPLTIDTYLNSRARVEWLDRRAGKETPVQISQFMRRVMAVGSQLRENHDWCSTYGSVLKQFGMTRVEMRRLSTNGERGIGTVVSPGQAAGLPVGTVLKHETPRMRVWFMRVRDSRNLAGTRRIFGRRLDGTVGAQRDLPLPHYAESMTIEGLPEEGGGLMIRLDWANEWNLIPAGTRFTYDDTDGEPNDNFWMCPDHTAHYLQGAQVGVYQRTAFNLEEMYVYSFPVPELRSPRITRATS